MPYADPEKSREYHTRKSSEWVKKYPKKRAKIAHKYWQSESGQRVKRKTRLKALFWTPEDYDRVFKEQKGVCAVCEESCHSGRKLAADHDHERKIPRGLLCNSCNLMIGKAGDNPRILEEAARYLRKHGR